MIRLVDAVVAAIAGTGSLDADLPVPEGTSPSDRKALIELAIRRRLLTLVEDEAAEAERFAVVDFAVQAAKGEHVSLSAPYVLLEDMVEHVTLNGCQGVFGYMERNVATWTASPFNISGCFTRLLRICNSLKRRLSRSQNTALCGRILIFLASIFPLCDRSGVNLKSSFNTGNTTSFQAGAPSDSEEPADAALDDKPIDYALHTKFWSLQRYFSEPTLCYTKDEWDKMASYASTVFKVFASHKLESLPTKVTGTEGQAPDTYFPKYLTSAKLLDLQTADSTFRRQVLVQFLVLFQYLQASIKFKRKTFVLTDKQRLWLDKSEKKVYRLLADTPPSGKEFVAAIKHLLKREGSWVLWKNEGCANFEKKRPAAADDEAAADAGRPKRLPLGTAELSRLWGISKDDLQGVREHKPAAIDTFFEEAIMQADPEACIEKEYWVTNNQNYCWRALRLLTKHRLHYFREGVTQPTMQQELRSAITRLAGEQATANAKMVPAPMQVGADAKEKDPAAEGELEAESLSATKSANGQELSTPVVAQSSPMETS